MCTLSSSSLGQKSFCLVPCDYNLKLACHLGHVSLRMRYFPSKHWEFVFSSIYYSINVTLVLSCMHKNRLCLPQFFAKDTYCDESSYHKWVKLTEKQKSIRRHFSECLSTKKSELSTQTVVQQQRRDFCQVLEAQEGLFKVRWEWIKSAVQQSFKIPSCKLHMAINVKYRLRMTSIRSRLDRSIELLYKCCNSVPVGWRRQNGNQSCSWGRCNVNTDLATATAA